MKVMTVFTVLIMTLLLGCALAQPPASKFTVQVLDEDTGFPVTNAVVQTIFEHQYDPWGNKPNIVDRRKEPVDQNGEAVFKGKCIHGGAGGTAFAEGYYSGHEGQASDKNISLNRWKPWNPTIKIKMRPKKNPVSMIKKRVESLKIPVWDKEIGFDLDKGDWVAPYGKGKRADFFVNMYRRFEHSSDYDATATISFPNKGDGIQLYEVLEEFKSSSFKFPYEAPTNNYQAKLILERHATLRSTKCSFNPDKDMYIFRVRTETDDEGNMVSACYGCINRRIEIGWGDVLDFEYHFNPVENERSLEWNGVNLFKKK
jgi:hypothetical protein